MKVYGDISGYLKTFQRLRSRLPSGVDLALADLIDRGPQSKEVLEWFIKNGKSILGNHEHMFLDFFYSLISDEPYEKIYSPDVWLRNGGVATLRSYGIDFVDFLSKENLKKKIPQEHIDYLKSLPWFVEEPGFIFTHAPIWPKATLESVTSIKNEMELKTSLLWNRNKPKKREGVIQVYGHNSAEDCLIHTFENPQGIYLKKFLDTKGPLIDNKDSIFAICIDTANQGDKLSCLHVPSFTIYQEEITNEDKIRDEESLG